MALVNRIVMAQSTVATRCWGAPAIVTLAAMAGLAALTADAAAREARPAPTTEATAPREAGEPIMAIVSIKSQQVTFYDADGWILRAPVSTGTTGRETPAGVFAIIEKQKDQRFNRRVCREHTALSHLCVIAQRRPQLQCARRLVGRSSYRRRHGMVDWQWGSRARDA